MKKLFILLYVSLIGILTACETILPLDMPEGEEWGITLNAVASPDTTFYAYVTHCYPNTEAPDYAYKNTTDFVHWEPDPVSDYYQSMLYSYYYYEYDEDNAPPFNNKKGYNLIKESAIPDAKVELTVNDETNYPMVYDTLMLCYQSDYMPVIGDRLEVRIKHASSEQTIARTEVPRPQKLEILEAIPEFFERKKYDGPFGATNQGYLKLRLRLHDPAGERNYYRLAVRSIHSVTEINEIAIWDLYSSSDPIFRDERLTSEWDGHWPAYFSDVFDDSQINGEVYEFEVQTYILKYVSYPDYWPSYEISLQSITEDYYRYLKSMQLYRISREDTYSEGVYIHSNNEGGWGLLGGISGEVHRVEPFKDMNESSEGNGSPTN